MSCENKELSCFREKCVKRKTAVLYVGCRYVHISNQKKNVLKKLWNMSVMDGSVFIFKCFLAMINIRKIVGTLTINSSISDQSSDQPPVNDYCIARPFRKFRRPFRTIFWRPLQISSFHDECKPWKYKHSIIFLKPRTCNNVPKMFQLENHFY